MSSINKSNTTVRTSAASGRAASKKTSSIWAPFKTCFGGSSKAAVHEEQEAVDTYLKHQMRSLRNGEHFATGRSNPAPNMATAAANTAMGTKQEPAKKKREEKVVVEDTANHVKRLAPKEKPLPLVPVAPANTEVSITTDNSAANAVILQAKEEVLTALKRKSLGMQHPSTRFFKERSAPRPRVENSYTMLTKGSPFAKDLRDRCPAPKREVNAVPVESNNISLNDHFFGTTEDFASGLRTPSRATVDSGYHSGRSSTTSCRSCEVQAETPKPESVKQTIKETIPASPVLQNNNRRTPHQRKRSVKDVARAMELREEALQLANHQHNTTAHARTGSQWKIQPGREPAACANNKKRARSSRRSSPAR
ncbi:hypothetical protein YB2330_001323 [Saitoella coloradoensis]